MKRALAIRHVCFEDLGIFTPMLKELGFTVEYLDAAVGDFNTLRQTPPDLLIVLGGPIGAFDDDLYPFLVQELDAVTHRIENNLPILGICLGAQLIARALGAKVYPMGHKEIGYSPLNFTEAGANSCLETIGNLSVLHWHGDQFDIPLGATLLAGSSLCPHQAFSVGDRVLALQFHVEADSRRIEHWLVGHAAELSGASVDPRDLRRQARRCGPLLMQPASEFLRHWISGFAIHENRGNSLQ